MRAGLVALALALVASSCTSGPHGPRHGEEVLAPYVEARVGGSLAALKQARPKLVPSGSPGAWLDPASDEVLEVEIGADGDTIVGVRVMFHDDRADVVEAKLRERLGAGRECSPFRPDVEGFRSTLWRLPDDTGVSIVRMVKQVKIHVARPAGDSFARAAAACGPPK